ncbi:MAG: DUF1152 domain-containing protein, partial [Chloroflexota bacterium]
LGMTAQGPAQPLNLPLEHVLKDAERVLIAGMGGGFDVYAGLPLYFALQAQGKAVHLANYSFTDLIMAADLSTDADVRIDGVLVGARGEVRFPIHYYPEGFLAQWFAQERNEDVTVWLFGHVGVRPLTMAYNTLIKHLGGVDAIILVDGGVDSLMRGDESGAGSVAGDSTSLAAVAEVDVPIKIVAAIGFGTEVEEGLSHAAALENMAALTAAGAFYGACALTPTMDAFQQYEAACRYVFEQPKHAHSHISTRIVPAARGAFGNHHMYPKDRNVPLFISPLMTVYWFYNAEAVIARNLLIDAIKDTLTSQDIARAIFMARRQMRLRPKRSIPY